MDRVLSVATAGVVVMALYFIVTERVIPALRGEPVRVLEGGQLPGGLEFETLDGSGTVAVAVGKPALLLVYSSTCPACYANLPAWHEVIEASGKTATILAVAVEADRVAALEYAEAHLSMATAVIDAEGILRFVRQGSLDRESIEFLIRALGALAGSSNS